MSNPFGYQDRKPQPAREKQFQYCQVIHTPVEKLEQENERLKVELAEARRLVEILQYGNFDDSSNECPLCFYPRDEVKPHSDKCRVGLFLAKEEAQAFLERTETK